MKSHRNEAIEEIAERRLLELEGLTGKPISPPIPLDLIAERLLGLGFLWEPVEELPGELILGALIPEKRLIVLNERHLELFRRKSGLERSTKGHEMGHWDLFVDQSLLDHPALFKEGFPAAAYRSTSLGDAAVMQILRDSAEGRSLLQDIQDRADEPDEARAVNRYAAALSMPRELVRKEAQGVDRTQWRSLYRLADRFDVTISALTVRLKQLNLLYVDDGVLYDSPDRAKGQYTFDF